MGSIPFLSRENDFKNIVHRSPLGAEHKKDSLEKKSTTIHVVSSGKRHFMSFSIFMWQTGGGTELSSRRRHSLTKVCKQSMSS